jgi:hypothetical protein
MYLTIKKSTFNFIFVRISYAPIFLALISFCACHSIHNGGETEEKKLFTLMPSSYTGIDFSNDLKYNERLNPYTYHNFYNGAGVAVGDINNDGLPDLFFCSNQGSNKLYLNKGNFQFEDITLSAGIYSDGLWSTGVTFADVNGDGLLDIYVCKAADFRVGWRGNQLYINNGDLTFTEKAEEYGLANKGFSVQAVFFDYDNDGDLDCYLLNNSIRSVGKFDLIKDQRKIVDSIGGNKLYRNDGNHFTDVTAQANIYSSKIGFGLGVTIADINKDGWPDIYVSNDFFERDYLYINKHDGTFDESLEKYIREISLNSMGADIADINNDGYPDIYVTDMLPQEESRIKSKTRFEDWEKYQADLKAGYYHQFTRNVLQLNRGPVYNKNDNVPEFHFSEISRLAGVEATDWSWGALIADLDNDGYKDIFVSNGIYKDVTDQDVMQFFYEDAGNASKRNMKSLIDLLPSHPIAKYAFANNGNLTFTNRAKEWGLDQLGFSNGSVYADLDNDGDLDLVTNNTNMPASVYRNNTNELHPENKFLQLTLKGENKNPFGLDAKVTVYYNHTLAYQENMPARGFESCIDSRLNFGLGKTKKIDSVKVEWQGGKEKILRDILPNQHITVKQSESDFPSPALRNIRPKPNLVFTRTSDNHGLNFAHKENECNDFNRDRLIYHMLSTCGPKMAKGDVNGDGLEDIYICGAKNQPGALFIQTSSGKFIKTREIDIEKDSACEDTDCLFFDADGDGDMDLFVCSGGNEFPADSNSLLDRLYINDGKGHFTKSLQILPGIGKYESSSTVSVADFDGDGDLDLFIGARLNPYHYGYPCDGHILSNNGKGIFTDVTEQVAPGLHNIGMITDGKWIDYDKDGKPDLVVAGEYMPLKIFHNEGGKLKEVTEIAGLEKTNGWWNRLLICDVNGDGYPDIVAANHGLNSRFRASEAKPVTMIAGDFANNNTIEQIICTYNGNKQYPMVLRHDLVSVLPYLKKKFLKYEDYKEKTVEDIFTEDQLKRAVKLNAYEMRSVVLLNDGKGRFNIEPLPIEAQFAPVFGMVAGDFDKDGKMDIVLGGNFYESKPEAGIYDGSYGLMLKGNGSGKFSAMSIAESNFFIKGAVRDMLTTKIGNKNAVVISRNNDAVEVLEY